MLKELLKDYGIAAHTKKGCILQSKEKKMQYLDEEYNIFDYEYKVYSHKNAAVIFTSYSYNKCMNTLKAM